MKLQNQVALITGAASGLGKAQAILFAKEGASVIVADTNLQGAEETVKAIQSVGGDAIAVQVDITSEESINQLVEKSLQKYSKISILSNTAGMFDQYTPLLDTSFELWSKVLDINISGIFRLTKAVLPVMIQNKYGIVINVASGAGLIGGGGGVAYTSSKHAVVGFTRQLNAEYGKQGIRSNAIAPGLIETPMVSKTIESKDSALMETLKKLPAGRHGQPDEIASVALFLASDDSRYIYGAIIPVDGGLLSTLR